MIRRSRALAKSLLALLAPLTASGCITAHVWDAADDRGSRVAAAAVTPITLALDAAIIAGVIYAECCGCRCDYDFDCD